ncbi:alpha/beta fold hydrolase [Streptomyces sp. NPDC050485]|uniref:alpha/beta fold hydrolase n=1 Tax=Streptomyces sp. NPDC050485 TaxID=3365617 RepID=UPI0037941C80
MTRSTKVPFVLLHALSLDSAMWQEQEHALTDSGHLVIPFDQRGFGGTPLGRARPSLDVVADDLAEALTARGTDRAVLVGSSMGAYVAMAFVRRHPDRTAGLALLSARVTADAPQARAQRLRFAELVQDDAVRETVLKQTTPQLVGATTRNKHPQVLARVLADAHLCDPAALAWAQRAIADRPDSTATLRGLGAPAVVIAGDEDELVTAAESRHTADTLPGGQLITIEGAGHLQPLEAPQAVTDALRVLGAHAC